MTSEVIRSVYEGSKRIHKIPIEMVHSLARRVSEGSSNRHWLSHQDSVGMQSRLCLGLDIFTSIAYMLKATETSANFGGFLHVIHI